MIETKASRFYQSALQSGLIDEAGLAACWALIPPEKRTPDAIDRRLARQTITSGRLTLWQAQQILAGRSNGYKIDKYVLLDLLGRGGMGRVYLARDIRLNRLVALKILSQERMNNPRAITRFQREAKVGAQLQHENLVRVYDAGESNGVCYLVMEYIEGRNAGQLIGELGAIPWPTAARLARQICLGLDHARLKELIHRDVNPCNILVTKDGTAKLTDLGLAIDLNDTDNVTRDGATVGTFDYVSPEQARHSRSVDTRADLYSLGCTLYHMIAGRVPFPVTSLPEKLYAHQLHDPEPLTDQAPGVPEGLAAVVRKMMKKLPEERYQTPMEAAQALEPYAIEAGWTTTARVGTPATSSLARTVESRPPTTENRDAAPFEVIPLTEAPGPWDNAPARDPGPDRQATPAPGPAGSGNGAGVAVGDSFFPLDLGPDETLREGSRTPSKKPGDPDPDAARDRARRVAVGVLAVVVAVAVVLILAMLALSGPGFGGKGGKAEAGPKVVRLPMARGDIVVMFRDGSSRPVKALPDAIAEGSTHAGAEVILAGGTTFRFSNEKPIRIPDGGLVLRAAEGARPVLEVKIKGSQPMFLVNANLKLQGVTVVVQYETASDGPVFQIERDLTFERCTFRAIGPAEGSRLAIAEGRKATISGCLFEGFETAVDVMAPPGMAVALKQSVFLSARPAEEAIGHALRVRSMFGQGAAGCRLSVENCSARAGSFLEAGNFKPASPLEVSVAGSAFLVRTLMDVEGDAAAPMAADEKDASIRWKGRDNRYQVTGGPWANFPNAPTDLDAWSKLTGEAGGKSEPLKLAKEPADPTTPRDCALIAEDGKPVGADPAMVGPQ